MDQGREEKCGSGTSGENGTGAIENACEDNEDNTVEIITIQ
jgi:hypothetical protein